MRDINDAVPGTPGYGPLQDTLLYDGQIRESFSQVPEGHVDPNQAFYGDQGASELLGQLNRAQWEDWKKRFAPYVERLAGEATDDNAATDAAAQASQSVGLAFDSAETINNQGREKYGVSLSPEQKQAQDRISSVGRTAAMASASNEARMSALDRQQSILAGGMGLSNIPDKVMNQ